MIAIIIIIIDSYIYIYICIFIIIIIIINSYYDNIYYYKQLLIINSKEVVRRCVAEGALEERYLTSYRRQDDFFLYAILVCGKHIGASAFAMFVNLRLC